MRRHQLDLTSLLCGLVFLGVGVVYIAGEISGEDVDVTWALPVTLIALGLAVVVGGLDRARRRPVDAATVPVDEVPDVPDVPDSTDSTDSAGAIADARDGGGADRDA